LIVLDKKLITTVGLEDMLVVDTADAILICKASDNQAVKLIVQELKVRGMNKYL
jgi:hypothetical protein